MFKKVFIKKNERGLLMERGDFVRVLESGEHRLSLNPFKRQNVTIVAADSEFNDETLLNYLQKNEVEVVARKVWILNESNTPPFPMEEDADVAEDARLKYRYVDLRRPRMQRNIVLRSEIAFAARQFLHAARLAFDHPITGERIELSSKLPDDLQAALDEARAE